MKALLFVFIVTGCFTPSVKEGREIPAGERALKLRQKREMEKCAICSDTVETYERCMEAVKKFK